MPGSQDSVPDPRNERALIYLNGALLPRTEAKVSVFDAGFLVGDGVWEGLRLHKGTLLFLDAHLERLYRGAKQISLDIGMPPPVLASEIRRLLDVNAMHDGVHLRVMVTRGEKSAPNQDPRNALGKATIVIAAEYRQPPEEVHRRGLKLATASIRCTPASMFDMRLNSHSRLNLIMALLEAIASGADEALMLDPNGFVSTCNATNFFIVRGATVTTSRAEYCFHGITRGQVLALCGEHGITTEARDFKVEEARGADEAFVTGTFGGITPVREIDGHVLNGPLPGPFTQRIHALYEALKDSQAG